MKKKRIRLEGVVAFALVLAGASAAQARDVVWAGAFGSFGDIHVYTPSGQYSTGYGLSGGPNSAYGGMTTVGDEVWLGVSNGSAVYRLDFSGNVLGTVPAFTTEATGGMTTVGDEVWWGSADSSTILRLDFAGNVLGSIGDPDGIRSDPTGGMTTVGDEVWWGPAGFSIFGRAIVRYDLDGNWLGSASDPFPGLILPPIDAPTHAMTTVGDEVWWFGTLLSTESVYRRLDASGNLLGTSNFLTGVVNANLTGFAMTTVPLPDVVVPSIHPIALWTLVPGLLLGAGLVAMRRRSGSVADSSAISGARGPG